MNKNLAENMGDTDLHAIAQDTKLTMEFVTAWMKGYKDGFIEKLVLEQSGFTEGYSKMMRESSNLYAMIDFLKKAQMEIDAWRNLFPNHVFRDGQICKKH
jgi:hypothetical protein